MPETLSKVFTLLVGQLPGAIIAALLTYYFATRQQESVLREARTRAARSLVALAKGLINEFREMRAQLDRAETGHYLVSYLTGEWEFLPNTLIDGLSQARELASHFDQGALGHWEEVFLAIARAETKLKAARDKVELERPREAPGYRESINRALKCLFAALHSMRAQSAPDTQMEIDHLLMEERKE